VSASPLTEPLGESLPESLPEPLTRAQVSSAPAPVRPSAWLPAFIALAAIWGSSFLFIKVGIRELHPAWVTFGRVSTGALTLLVLLLVTRDRLPRGLGLWARMAVLAFIGNVIPFTLFGYGEQRVSSIVAGIWNATTPLMVLLVSLAFLPAERPTGRRVAGLGVGFVGVLTVLGVWHGIGGGELVGQLMCAAAAVCYGFAIPSTAGPTPACHWPRLSSWWPRSSWPWWPRCWAACRRRRGISRGTWPPACWGSACSAPGSRSR
jgi:drug/metabolite transporter (DMT)-like permease